MAKLQAVADAGALNLPILITKLQRPRVQHGLVARPQLWAMLDRGLEKPMTLVNAGAGFGKTTLVITWLEAMTARAGTTATPAAWLSLDTRDNDLGVFVRYVVAALRTIFPGVCADTLALMQSPQKPSVSLVHGTLSNDLTRLPARTILVLDDYSAITNEAIHELMVALVQNWPQLLHMVLITRRDPPLPLSAMRARNGITEIRSQHLRFSHAETAAYLAKELDTPIDEAAVVALEERVEGWIAGLKLALLSLDSGVSVTALVAALSDHEAGVTAYLADEVFLRQPAAIQEFLIKISVLDHYCISLCEAVVGEVQPGWTVAAYIQWLVRANLYVVSLDSNRQWFRFQHLFRDMLRQRAAEDLTPEQINELHRRAATWFASQHLVDEGLYHALRAEDPILIIHLIEQGLPSALNRMDFQTLDRWLGLLPEPFVERRPELLMLKVWALNSTWQLRAQARVLDQIETLLDQEAEGNRQTDSAGTLRAQIATLRGQEAFFGNQPALAISLQTRALAHLPENWTYLRAAALMYLALSLQTCGRADEAERLLLEAYEQRNIKTDHYAVRLQMALCLCHLAQGELEQVQLIAADMLRKIPTGELVTMECWAHYFLGIVQYQWNDLEGAEQHLAAIVERSHAAIMIVVSEGLFQHALTTRLRGNRDAAWQTLQMLSSLQLNQGGSEEEATRALRAHLMLLDGDLEGACRWADSFAAPVPDKPLLWVGNPHLTKVRVLLVRQGARDLLGAQKILDELLAVAERTYNVRFRIEIQAMRALVLDLLGQPEALATLEEAVDRAIPSGTLRPFLDLGMSMRALLERLGRQGKDVRRLLAAFADGVPHDGQLKSTENLSRFSPALGPAESAAGLVEALTVRELQLLDLMCEPLSMKEIAYKLNISPLTAKRHASNIYGKLGVNSRWDAVAKAEAIRQHLPR